MLPHREDILRDVVDQVAPNKLKLSTLQEVFVSFWETLKTPLAFDSHAYHKFPVFFEYESRSWKGTVIHQPTSLYNSKKVYFINLKLPNDGFFYTADYTDAQDAGRLERSEETIGFLKSIFGYIQETAMFESQPNIDIHYWKDRQRFSVRLWTADKSRCLSIEWEYGWHEGLKNDTERESQKWDVLLAEVWPKNN